MAETSEGDPSKKSKESKKRRKYSSTVIKTGINESTQKLMVEAIVERPTSYAETLMHILRGNLGTGLFAMGDAFKNSGLLVAPIGMMVICTISLHMQHTLLKAALKLQSKYGMECPPEFASTFFYIFATSKNLKVQKCAMAARLLINVFLCVTQWGFNCIHIVFVSSNFQKVLEYFDVHIDIHSIMLMFFLPIWASCMVLNLKYMSPISTVANVVMLIGLGMILFFLLQDIPPVSRLPLYVDDWQRYPLFFATVLYGFEGIGLVLPLNREMKNTRLFGVWYGVLNVGTFIVFACLLIMGVLSYIKYGDDVKGSVTINLPNHIVAVLSQLAVIIAVSCTFCLQFYIPVGITWTPLDMKYNFNYPDLYERIYRTVIVIIIFVLAEAIPYLSLFISLIGAIGSTALAIIFPPILEMVINLDDPKKYICTYIKDILILILGIVGMFVGTFYAALAIVEAFKKDFKCTIPLDAFWGYDDY